MFWDSWILVNCWFNNYFTSIAKEKLHFFVIYSSYCCLIKGGWALKVASQFVIWGLVAYKPVGYKKIIVINVCININYKPLSWLTLIERYMCTFCQWKKKNFVLCSLLNDWNYFWKKYSNLSFRAICLPNFPFWYFLRHLDKKERKLLCEWASKIKKIIILEDFIK